MIKMMDTVPTYRRMTRVKTSLFLVLLWCGLLLYGAREAHAAVTVTYSGSDTGTATGANNYYRAGYTYAFAAVVQEPAATGWADVTRVRLQITGGGVNLDVEINPGATGAGQACTVNAGGVTATADITSIAGIPAQNFTIQFNLTFLWSGTQYTPQNLTYTISAESTVPSTGSDTDGPLLNGIATQVRVLNFAQTGDAADNRINPWHTAFNVQGTLIYDVGTTAADIVPAGEISSIELYHNPGAVASGFTDTDGNLSFAVTADYFSGLASVGVGNHTWYVIATMNTGGANETTTNTLAIECNRVQIQNIQFQNGGGLSADPTYYRSRLLPGTQVRVQARMELGGGNVLANTTLTISYVYGAATRTTDVTITAGNNYSGWAMVTYPTDAEVPVDANGDEVLEAGDYTTNYEVSAIISPGSSYEEGDGGLTGQNAAGRIGQDATPPNVYWDDGDPPGRDNNDPFTAFGSQSTTADTLTVGWTALAAGGVDGDFSSYRIYFRENGATGWNMVDSTTVGYAALGVIGTTTATITGLQSLTRYDYYITAVDIYGNEVPQTRSSYFGAPVAPDYATYATTPATTTIEISDGITSYEDDSFTANNAPAARPLRQSAIRVTANLVAGASQPESLNLLLASGDAAAAPDLIVSGAIDGGLTEGTDYYRFSFIKVAPNKWVTHIPDTNALIAVGTDCRFLLEAVRGTTRSYFDHDAELEVAPGDPNDYEWTFTIIAPPAFQPWPVRILNNVITRANPRAYPAYYLSADAYVTIKVYDVKGRPVATLLDNAFRRGGNNIKEGGWAGVNKTGKKLGIGLYYIRIKAKRASDGKVILHKTKKVVIRK